MYAAKKSIMNNIAEFTPIPELIKLDGWKVWEFVYISIFKTISATHTTRDFVHQYYNPGADPEIFKGGREVRPNLVHFLPLPLKRRRWEGVKTPIWLMTYLFIIFNQKGGCLKQYQHSCWYWLTWIKVGKFCVRKFISISSFCSGLIIPRSTQNKYSVVESARGWKENQAHGSKKSSSKSTPCLKNWLWLICINITYA